MDDIFERRLETRKQIVMELQKQMYRIEEDIAFERVMRSWDRVEKLKHYQSKLLQSIHHLEGSFV